MPISWASVLPPTRSAARQRSNDKPIFMRPTVARMGQRHKLRNAIARHLFFCNLPNPEDYSRFSGEHLDRATLAFTMLVELWRANAGKFRSERGTHATRVRDRRPA